MSSFLDTPELARRNTMLIELFAALAHLPHVRQLEILAAWLPMDALETCYQLNVVEKMPHVRRKLEPLVIRFYVGVGGIQTRKEFSVYSDGGTWLRRMWEIYGERLHVQDVHGKWRTRARGV